MKSLIRRLAHRPAVERRPLQRLDVRQHEGVLRIRFQPVPEVDPLALWAYDRDADTWTRLGAVTPAGSWWAADVDLRHLLAVTATVPAVVVDGSTAAVAAGLAQPADDPDRAADADDDADDEGATVVLHLEVRQTATDDDVLEGLLRRPLAARLEGRPAVQYRLPLGQAQRTRTGRLSTVTGGVRRASPYTTAGGYVGVALDRDLGRYADVNVRRLDLSGGVLRMSGRIATRHGDVSSVNLLLKGRTSGYRVTRPVTVEPDDEQTERRFGLRWYRFSVSGDCAQLLDDDAFTADVYDVWMTVATEQAPEPFAVRVGRTRFLARYLTRAGWAERGGRAVALTPYYTYRARKTTLQVDLFDASTFRYLRSEVRNRHLTRLRHWRREVWLVGERPYKAQDTGFHLFKHLRENHPDLEAYYVIEHDSPERGNVEPLGNVLDFGSREHIRATLLARRVLGSHHADFLYPLRTKQFRRAVRATRVFLQHGVMGTKWLVPMYGKQVASFETDLFVVSSEREKQYIVGDFGYAPDEVAVTGLPRFDSLLAGDVEVNARQLLVMPTWRDWLQDPDAYPDSEYHESWSRFLHHPRLQALTERHGLEVVFCLHPNMQQYRELFADVPARLISQGEVDVQLLLKQSAMLVTDFSSVGFDFSFLHKPIAYFQFDRERFLGPQGSHLDLDDELPGTIVWTADALVAEVEARAADGFTMLADHVRRADRFLTHRDLRSGERVYEQARAARRSRHVAERVRTHELVGAGLRALRRHRYYFPLMRLMFRLLKRLPADDGLVLFESGVGRQYADSPRYVYEELVRRGSPLRKVWAYSGRLPVVDEHTTVVNRLSPAYYYHLARARYWVSNQSFPHYVTRRPDGVYVQTWHGTPLKRMLHDLDEVHGRDSGYVDRATAAARQWSVLVSPSPFATAVMRSAFRYEGEVLEQGYPRNDLFHREDRDELAARVRRRLGVPQDAKVVLYAPTFRDDQVSASGRFTFELPFDLETLCAGLGDDTVLLLRMHVLVRGRMRVPEHLRHRVLDVSGYPEIQELYLASDVLVTDYSSVFFDFAALRRPIVFYAYDLESYRDDLRGFYLDYATDLPGPVVTTQDDLVRSLNDLAAVDREFSGRYEAFLARFAPHDDGHAAARVVDAVFGPRSGGA